MPASAHTLAEVTLCVYTCSRACATWEVEGGEGEGALSSLCCRRVIAGQEGEGMSGEGKGDGEGEDEDEGASSSSSSSFSVICRERAGARVMARASRRRREGEGVVEGALSSGRG